MFRVLVLVLGAAVPVIATALLIGTGVALVVLGLELAFGAWLAWSALRARRAGSAEPGA